MYNTLLCQVAAQLDRSETAKHLIERSAEAGVVDDSGTTALVLMITKMPNVVGERRLLISCISNLLMCLHVIERFSVEWHKSKTKVIIQL